jgi:MYXO-CTERM domain-containing protein
MRRLAALSTFLLLAGVSMPAFADEPPERPKRSGEKKNCSVSDEDDAILGLAALALLVSAVGLRRHRPMPKR